MIPGACMFPGACLLTTLVLLTTGNSIHAHCRAEADWPRQAPSLALLFSPSYRCCGACIDCRQSHHLNDYDARVPATNLDRDDPDADIPNCASTALTSRGCANGRRTACSRSTFITGTSQYRITVPVLAPEREVRMGKFETRVPFM